MFQPLPPGPDPLAVDFTCGQFVAGTDIPGTNIGEGYTASNDECLQFCTDTEGCSAMVRDDDSGGCFLKSVDAATVEHVATLGLTSLLVCDGAVAEPSTEVTAPAPEATPLPVPDPLNVPVPDTVAVPAPDPGAVRNPGPTPAAVPAAAPETLPAPDPATVPAAVPGPATVPELAMEDGELLLCSSHMSLKPTHSITKHLFAEFRILAVLVEFHGKWGCRSVMY